MIGWNGKSGVFDRQELRITFHWHLAVCLKSRILSMFLYNKSKAHHCAGTEALQAVRPMGE
jgi:hypothetical protein